MCRATAQPPTPTPNPPTPFPLTQERDHDELVEEQRSDHLQQGWQLLWAGKTMYQYINVQNTVSCMFLEIWPDVLDICQHS
jgi:hypothetical protein